MGRKGWGDGGKAKTLKITKNDGKSRIMKEPRLGEQDLDDRRVEGAWEKGYTPCFRSFEVLLSREEVKHSPWGQKSI